MNRGYYMSSVTIKSVKKTNLTEAFHADYKSVCLHELKTELKH